MESSSTVSVSLRSAPFLGGFSRGEPSDSEITSDTCSHLKEPTALDQGSACITFFSGSRFIAQLYTTYLLTLSIIKLVIHNVQRFPRFVKIAGHGTHNTTPTKSIGTHAHNTPPTKQNGYLLLCA